MRQQGSVLGVVVGGGGGGGREEGEVRVEGAVGGDAGGAVVGCGMLGGGRALLGGDTGTEGEVEAEADEGHAAVGASTSGERVGVAGDSGAAEAAGPGDE